MRKMILLDAHAHWAAVEIEGGYATKIYLAKNLAESAEYLDLDGSATIHIPVKQFNGYMVEDYDAERLATHVAGARMAYGALWEEFLGEWEKHHSLPPADDVRWAREFFPAYTAGTLVRAINAAKNIEDYNAANKLFAVLLWSLTEDADLAARIFPLPGNTHVAVSIETADATGEGIPDAYYDLLVIDLVSPKKDESISANIPVPLLTPEALLTALKWRGLSLVARQVHNRRVLTPSDNGYYLCKSIVDDALKNVSFFEDEIPYDLILAPNCEDEDKEEENV